MQGPDPKIRHNVGRRDVTSVKGYISIFGAATSELRGVRGVWKGGSIVGSSLTCHSNVIRCRWDVIVEVNIGSRVR